MSVKEIPLKHSYDHLELSHGSVSVFGEGGVREIFTKAVETWSLNDDIGKGLERLLEGIYQETGEMPHLAIYNSSEFDPTIKG